MMVAPDPAVYMVGWAAQEPMAGAGKEANGSATAGCAVFRVGKPPTQLQPPNMSSSFPVTVDPARIIPGLAFVEFSPIWAPVAATGAPLFTRDAFRRDGSSTI